MALQPAVHLAGRPFGSEIVDEWELLPACVPTCGRILGAFPSVQWAPETGRTYALMAVVAEGQRDDPAEVCCGERR